MTKTFNIFEGDSKSEFDDKYAVVVSKFNSFATEKLLEGCVQTLLNNGVYEKHLDVVTVPGAFEIPVITKNLLDSKKYNAIICLGAVIRGETPHFDYICSAVSSELASLGVLSGIPVIFGVITTNTIEQAMDRAGGKVGNKGSEAALAAIEMVSLKKIMKDKTEKDKMAEQLGF